jgi:hypothetical protein
MSTKICFPIKYKIPTIGDIDATIGGKHVHIPGHGSIEIIKWICIDVPVLINNQFVPKPDPEQLRNIGDWLKGEDINPVALGELRILATIGSLSNALVSPEAQDLVLDALTSAVAHLDLPAEARLTLNGRVVREHRIPNVIGSADMSCE